jgi:hypothetical protein
MAAKIRWGCLRVRKLSVRCSGGLSAEATLFPADENKLWDAVTKPVKYPFTRGKMTYTGIEGE